MPDQMLEFGDTLAALCGIGFLFKYAARSIEELLPTAREQGFTDLKLATNPSDARNGVGAIRSTIANYSTVIVTI
jgi:hypothetical protein